MDHVQGSHVRIRVKILLKYLPTAPQSIRLIYGPQAFSKEQQQLSATATWTFQIRNLTRATDAWQSPPVT